MTDTPSRVNKRSRSFSSSNRTEEDGNLSLSVNIPSVKVGDLMQEQLISVLSSLLDTYTTKLCKIDTYTYIHTPQDR